MASVMPWWIVENTLLAALLALLVALVSRSRRVPPVVRHGLWLVVLVKLIVPPVFSLGISVPGIGLPDFKLQKKSDKLGFRMMKFSRIRVGRNARTHRRTYILRSPGRVKHFLRQVSRQRVPTRWSLSTRTRHLAILSGRGWSVAKPRRVKSRFGN